MTRNRFFSAAFFTMLAFSMMMSVGFAQGGYIGPSSITNPSHEAQYKQILGGVSVDTISITAPESRVNSSMVYLLEDGNQGVRTIELDSREQVFLVEDLATGRMAVHFEAFHIDFVEVKVYNESRKIVFWKKGYEVFSGEQIVIDYRKFEGGKYFLHVNTNDGTVIKQHFYKTHAYYTASN